LLLFGAKRPQTIGQNLKVLLRSTPLLVGMDTHRAASMFLKAIFPLLTSEERAEIERLILSVPDSFPLEEREFGEDKRNQLLIGLTVMDLVVPETVSLVTSLQTSHPEQATSRTRSGSEI